MSKECSDDQCCGQPEACIKGAPILPLRSSLSAKSGDVFGAAVITCIAAILVALTAALIEAILGL